mmetsp:Transcript_69308/g.133721  ORF Transcript_69308/g.133721 Transcript_69308/m.133721 type:complete len:153 (+) Transcript_69308:36-494(+)
MVPHMRRSSIIISRQSTPNVVPSPLLEETGGFQDAAAQYFGLHDLLDSSTGSGGTATALAANDDDGTGSECTGSDGRGSLVLGSPCSTLLRRSRFSSVLAASLHDCHCAICCQDLADGAELSTMECGHFFHAGCAEIWLNQNSSGCPTCKKS